MRKGLLYVAMNTGWIMYLQCHVHCSSHDHSTQALSTTPMRHSPGAARVPEGTRLRAVVQAAVYFCNLIVAHCTTLKDCLKLVDSHAALAEYSLTRAMRGAIAGELGALRAMHFTPMPPDMPVDLEALTRFVWEQYRQTLAASRQPLTEVPAFCKELLMCSGVDCMLIPTQTMQCLSSAPT